MAMDILERAYQWLIIVAFVFSVLFAAMLIGHTSYLICERILSPEKSKERWELMEKKFEHSTPIIKIEQKSK